MVMQAAKQLMWVCVTVYVQNYSSVRFILPSQGPIPGPIMVNGPSGEWGGKIHGSCGITTSQTRLRFRR